MKQIAVEWLQCQLKDVKYNPLETNGYSNALESLFNQAKEMEKQQIENAFTDGVTGDSGAVNPEQYYNETFKNK